LDDGNEDGPKVMIPNVGNDDGVSDGADVGPDVGDALGADDGDSLGTDDGDALGADDRSAVGAEDGDALGADDGDSLGAEDRSAVGPGVGIFIFVGFLVLGFQGHLFLLKKEQSFKHFFFLLWLHFAHLK